MQRLEVNDVKQRLFQTILLFFSICFLSFSAEAQESGTTPTSEIPAGEIEIPFIDRDSDGINDLLQNGWGLRFVERYKKRQELWEQLNVEIIRDEDGKKVDTDGDGVGDISFPDFMKQKMDELIDSDGDGEGDTPLREYMGGRFKSFDQDGDGLPDNMSSEEVKGYMNEMKQWREEIRERVSNGESPFVDDDEDGVPDNLPKRFQRRLAK